MRKLFFATSSYPMWRISLLLMLLSFCWAQQRTVREPPAYWEP